MKSSFKKLFPLFLFLNCIFGFSNLVFAAETDKSAALASLPKLSIIMPVYNVAPYLDEALDSAENQTYKDLEIICVNDGSTDNSIEILEKHAEKDSRIRIISQENQGLSGARNTGMRVALGEYIYFFDSDDILAPHAMEKAIENLEKYNADASEFNYVDFKYDTHIDMRKYVYKERLVEVIESDGKSENPIKKFGRWPVMVWCRVYRKSFLEDNNLYFKKHIRLNEDQPFNLCSKACMHKLVKDKNIGYFYRVKRPGSLMNTDYRVINKRMNGCLMMVRELVLNKDKFNFSKGQEYLLSDMLDYTYMIMHGLKSSPDKRFYASKIYEEIWTNFAKKYKVKISKENKKKLNDLKKWSGNSENNNKKMKSKNH